MKVLHKFAGALVVTGFFVTQLAVADDLSSVYKLAVSNDPEFQAARAQYMANRELSSQAWAVLLPQISGQTYQSDTTTDVISSSGSMPVGSSSYETSGYSLNLTQTIYDQAKFSALSAANSKVAQAMANFDYAKQSLILRTAKHYFDVLGAEDNLAFSRAEKKSIAHQLEQTTQRFNVGLTAITDVHEAQARYDQSVARDIAAENQLAISKEILREMTGQEHVSLNSLQTNSPLVSPEPANIKEWVQTALANNFQLIAASKNQDAASSAIMQARAGHFPSLNINASKSSTDTGGGSAGAFEKEDTTVMLQLSVPIFNGGLVSSKTSQAAYQYQQAKQLHEKQRRATERQARNAYLSVLANISQVKALKQALSSSQTALKATHAGFKVGTRTTVDVLNSQRELYRAKRDYALARYAYILETLRLKQAAGTLKDQDLMKINGWLQSAAATNTGNP
ncbi:MAG: TolC family outer membrane protein [Gammaproteobacteria bacterium]|nr:TolC family outer membrane protein [Gammaproteobacteria bacterium]